MKHWKFLHSLRARMIFGAIIWTSAGVWLAGLFLATLFRDYATELFYSELRSHLQELVSIINVDSMGLPVTYRSLSDPRFSQYDSGYSWQVSRDGRVLIKSTSESNHIIPVPDDPLAPDELRQITFEGPRGPMIGFERMLVIPGAEPLRVQLTADVAVLEGMVGMFNLGLAVSLGLLAVALIAAAVLQVAIGLRPLSRLRTALTEIRSGRAVSLPEDFPSEVQPLIEDLNAMLTLNSQIIQRARAQAGNLAHGLKTPLAILTDEAERLERKGDKETAALIAQQCQRMQRQIDYQIARTRAAASRSVPGVAAPVAPTVQNIVNAMKRLYADRNLRYEIAVSPDCVVLCDPMDLNEMLANLIDNACKWGKSRVAVYGGADRRAGEAIITIEDDGPGLPSESLEVVFQIGQRLDERTPGSGLGLSIVRDLAQLYGGEVTLAKSGLGGLQAQLRLPLAQ